ncbi:MAG: TetR/AcrR family transcriptional regulator; helix-turn-helix transcriptional regulator [Rhodobacterales bacterium]|nr:TetR/AcrR family transcriptional regulator; helix-turn-helix transcriptional regulator [Rhodobacterales bacterium]MDX5413703.1 TetR/AcrR family transcriptional regulator; helix-turn-helix transcriptional regulator [Rhodobacterales bacterium]
MLDHDDLTTEALCRYMLDRHRDTITVQKPEFALRKLNVIIAAALDLSNRKGFQAMSLRDLSRASGVSMGGLYAYFDSKTTLLNMILSEVTAAVERVLSTPPAAVQGDPVAHLNWLIATHIQMTEAMQPWFTFAFMEAKNFPPRRTAQGHRQRGTDRELFPVGDRGRRDSRRLPRRYLAASARAHQTPVAGLVCQTRQVPPPARFDLDLYRHGAGFRAVGLSGRH